MAKYEIEYPKNLVIQGLLSFPLLNENNIEQLHKWRVDRQIKKPKFDDKISVSLLLNQANLDKAADYLVETYLPFAATLWGITNEDKGIDPALITGKGGLLEKAKKRDWSGKDLPIRELNAKDIENNEDDIVAKIKILGPYESEFSVKGMVQVDGTKEVVSLQSLIDDGTIPESRKDVNTLWWGAGWNFRTSIRFNAFDAASVGVSAYGQTLYLLPHLGLPTFGGNGDADVIEDGDDWEE